MRFLVLTLFPEIIEGALGSSITAQARKKGLLDWQAVQLRQYCPDKHQTIDDKPFGGGGGMVMKAQPLVDALVAAKQTLPGAKAIYLSPQGRRLDQAKVKELAAQPGSILLCGHYEGLDERAMGQIDEELSIGDYVLTGGELGACVLIDAVARLIPGVLGNEDSAPNDSFEAGLLEHPHYTRPAQSELGEVPAVLLNGDHGAIATWRRQQSLANTLKKRPDLLETATLDKKDREFLKDLGWISPTKRKEGV
jgi:tRNA (guanine37-N1)-methyltransferase